ncbi:hypothetical protein ACFOSD_12075 [Salinispirillum marinum]|uniref:EamA domain-containing protein n=2 Tax=Saccharospirillaceae TaxID=255527 RepID=A0ABV8BH12_9GAMM
MDELTGVVIAVVLGILASSCLHLSQGFMRLGIVRMRASTPVPGGRVFYVIGLLLNFSAPFWVMVANVFAPTLWFTSMFATGLLTLMVFSHYYLNDPITWPKTFGVSAILLATGLLAVTGLSAIQDFKPPLVLLLSVSLAWVLAMPTLAILCRHARLPIQEMLFGTAAGGFFALDALWKSAAQQMGGDTTQLLPATPLGWLILMASFGGAAGAFAMMQWSYLRFCRASAVVVSYNMIYVLLPLSLLALMGIWEAFTLPMLAAIVLLLGGAALIQFKGHADVINP